jgi:hypothetical protein
MASTVEEMIMKISKNAIGYHIEGSIADAEHLLVSLLDAIELTKKYKQNSTSVSSLIEADTSKVEHISFHVQA